MEVGSQQRHNLHVTGDRDWVAFQAEAGTEYVIETFNLGERIDTFLSLYDAEGRLMATDDDLGAEPLASRLFYEAGGDGTLYVMAQDLGDREAGPGTEYWISVRQADAVVQLADRYEPDDGIEDATNIRAGDSQRHSMHIAGDQDWLSLEVEAGVTYVVASHALGEEMDTVLFLYDESGQEWARDDDGGDQPRASRLSWRAEQTGTVYLMVQHHKEDSAGPEMVYDLSVCRAGEATLSALPGVHLADGAYHIVTFDTYEFVVGVSELLSPKDFALEIEAEQVSGEDDNEYGLVYGYQDDDNYYEVAISGDGYVGFFVKYRGRWETISPFRRSNAINRGASLNLLRLEVQRGLVSFYVNGQLALQDFDTRLAEGLVGVGCGSFGQPGLHCAFDNLRIWDQEGGLVWQDDFEDNRGKWFQSTAP
ncbi:MAG TPA: hypothetical protein ENO24_09715 [Chloroflexi bacterium]|nr:hypothetical protein [Chloroflexota bacterium]